MNAHFLRTARLVVATGSILFAIGCSASSGGGGGGVALAKDTTNGADTTTSANDTMSSDMVMSDTMGMPDVKGGDDLIAVEIIDKPDQMTADITPKDTSKPDVAKQDTAQPAGCLATSNCDPISNDCAGTGEACDIDQSGASGCFPPPNETALGGACDNQNGPFCVGGYHCGQKGTCQKFCCSNSDCNSGQTCTPFGIVSTDTIGVCDP